LDTLLVNGDFAPGSNGLPRPVIGTRELFQRAMIRLNVPFGAFDYDASLGSRLHGLNPADTGFETQALAAAQEALRPLTGVSAVSVRLVQGTPPAVAVECVCGEEHMEIEVKL
jgi:hypothetical protein